MGTSSTVAQLNAKLASFEVEIEKAERESVSASALLVKNSVLGFARPATGGDLKLSGTRSAKGNLKAVNVRYRMENSGKSAFVKAVGPMHWLESGVQPHAIIPGGTSKKVRGLLGTALGGAEGPVLGARQAAPTARGKKAKGLMVWNGGKAAAYWIGGKAGGLRAMHVWSKGVNAARPGVAKMFNATQYRAMHSVFGRS